MQSDFVAEHHRREQIQIATDVIGTMVDLHVEPLDLTWDPREEVVTSANFLISTVMVSTTMSKSPSAPTHLLPTATAMVSLTVPKYTRITPIR